MNRTPLLKRSYLLLLVIVSTAVFLLARLSTPVQADPAVPSFDCATASGINEVDCVALVALFDSTGGPSWTTATNWTTTNTPCSAGGTGWYGVTCDGPRVTSILLQDNNLEGPLPVALGALSELQLLGLSDNSINGALPNSLGLLAKLNGLYLARNSLEGAIPPELGGLLQIQSFYLNGNMLEGDVPTALCTLVNKTTPNPEIINFDLGFNALAVEGAPACFASAGFAWEATQTVPPEIVEVDTATEGEITLRWNPIPFNETSHPDSSGGYEIFKTTTPGVYGPDPERRTTARTDTEATIELTNPDEKVYFKIRTQTNALPDVNDNILHSAFTSEVSSDFTALSLTTFQGGGPQPSWWLWVALLLGLLFVPPGVAWLVRRYSAPKE